MIFEPPEMDFGLLPPGGVGHGTITVRNPGARPLRILLARTSCGCTTASDLAGRVIEPHGEIRFDTTMEMKSGLGPKREKVGILFEGYTGGLVEYHLRAEVTLPIHATPPYLAAVNALRGEIVVESLDGAPFRILAAQGRPPDFVDGDSGAGPPRARCTIRWDLTEADRAGSVPWFWVLQTDRPDCPIVDLRVRHPATRPPRPPNRPWVPRDQRVILGVVDDGEPVEVETKIEFAGAAAPAEPAAEVHSDSPFLRAELLGTRIEGRVVVYRIRLTPRGAGAGLLYGRVRIGAVGFEARLVVIGVVGE